MKIVKIAPGDLLEMKKPHPCGSKILRAVRVGSDVRVICEGCGRDMVIPREKLEKSIKKVSGSSGGNGA